MKRKLHSHSTPHTGMVFGLGPESARALVLDLNEMEDRSVAESLGQLICDFVELSRLMKDKQYLDNRSRMFGSKPRELWQKILNQLGQATWSPRLFPPSDNHGLHYVWMPNSSGREEVNRYVGTIFNLAALGLLGQIRSCRHCRKWFLTSKGIHRFCSVNCRVSYYRKTDLGRARNRKYMQQYRVGLKRRDQAMLSVSRRGR